MMEWVFQLLLLTLPKKLRMGRKFAKYMCKFFLKIGGGLFFRRLGVSHPQENRLKPPQDQ